jgi:uncharacterized protein (TIGR02145 family)
VVIANPLPDINVIGDSRNCAGTVTLSASSSLDAEIDWYADASTTTKLETAASYTTPKIATSTTYYVQARVENTGCLSVRVPVSAEVVITEECCDAPGATGVTFAAFNPCSGASYTSTYTLTDARDQKQYKVKYLPDGRYWMVQDLKFGDRCDKTTFSGSTSTQTGKINSTGTYYGDCCSNPTSCGGYYYDWSAIVNKPDAYSGSNSYPGCAGTTAAANACQGICPEGWHVPTAGEYDVLLTSLNSYYACDKLNCMTIFAESAACCAVYGTTSETNCSTIIYITSSPVNDTYIWEIADNRSVMSSNANGWKKYGYPARCTRNL